MVWQHLLVEFKVLPHSWRQQQKKRSEEYRRKLTYLKEYNEICSTVVSQLKRMSCHRTYF